MSAPVSRAAFCHDTPRLLGASAFPHWSPAERLERKAALESRTDSRGGFAIPTQLAADLLTKITERSIVRTRRSCP